VGHTDRQTGDLISLRSFLESRLKNVNIVFIMSVFVSPCNKSTTELAFREYDVGQFY
jgi:hypothetical protein